MADDLSQLAKDLSQAPRDAWPLVAKALGVTALKIKNDWSENLGGSRNAGSAFRHIGRTVDYDITAMGGSLVASALSGGGGTGLQAEIGPNLAKKQGAMAGWFEEGQSNIPALHPGYDAMKKNEGDFEDGLRIAVDQALRKANL